MATKAKAKEPVAADPQVEQLQAALESKEAQVNSLTEQVKELGGYKKEAVDGRETIAGHESKIEELEAAIAAAQREAAEARSAVKAIESRAGSDAKKVEAALKIAEGVKAIL